MKTTTAPEPITRTKSLSRNSSTVHPKTKEPFALLREMNYINKEPQYGNQSPLLSVSPDGIPDDLKRITQWVVWEADWVETDDREREHRLRMVPCDPVTKKPVLLNGSAEGATFETAFDTYVRDGYAGIGIILTDHDPLVTIQIADALSGDGLPRLEAARVLRTLAVYAEKSPDGLGLTLVTRGHLPPGGCRRETIELSETERFVPITGWRLSESPAQIVERQAALEDYHAELFPAPPKRFVPVSNTGYISDDEMLRTAFSASNGARIQQLYKGDTSVIPGGRNAADLALCSMLGFFTGNDHDRLDRLFRKSALFRHKWDSVIYSNGKTYGQATIAKALEGCLVFHSYPVQPVQSIHPARPALEPYAERTGERNGKKRKKEERLFEEDDETFSPPMFAVPPLGQPMGMSPSSLSSVPGTNGNSPVILPVAGGDNVNPIIFAEQMGRAEGLAQRETVLNAKEAANLLKISPKLLRRTLKPWRRFGGSPAGDRWLLSDLLSKIPEAS